MNWLSHACLELARRMMATTNEDIKAVTTNR
jgi:hypothetical protein